MAWPVIPTALPCRFHRRGRLPYRRYHNSNLYYVNNRNPFFGDGGGGAGDLHDNNINYSWCTPITGKENTKDVS
jgi:hypothetical protein